MSEDRDEPNRCWCWLEVRVIVARHHHFAFFVQVYVHLWVAQGTIPPPPSQATTAQLSTSLIGYPTLKSTANSYSVLSGDLSTELTCLAVVP